MHVIIKILKHQDIEIDISEMATIKNLQMKILSYLRIPITEHNLKVIRLVYLGEKCDPSRILSTFHIKGKFVIHCSIKFDLLEKIKFTNFEEEDKSDNQNSGNDMYNDSSGRLYQSSTYIHNDNYVDDFTSDPSELPFYFAQRDMNENPIPHQNTLPNIKDIILKREDNCPRGHRSLIRRFEALQNISNNITRAKSNYNFNTNLNLSSSSFTSSELAEPSCEALPCCFPNIPYSYSENTIYVNINYENKNENGSVKNSSNDDHHSDNENNNNSNNSNNNIIL